MSITLKFTLAALAFAIVAMFVGDPNGQPLAALALCLVGTGQQIRAVKAKDTGEAFFAGGYVTAGLLVLMKWIHG